MSARVPVKASVQGLRLDRGGVPGSGTGQDGAVQQAEGQRSGPAHRQDDGVQGGQDVALCVVGLQGLRQLGQRGHELDRRTATCRDGEFKLKV